MSDSIYQFEVNDIKGNKVSLADFRGKTLLIVNTASKCGFTPQYEGLESLYESHKDKGLVVLGFPCNQFGKQEPGSDQEIANFCDLTFKVSFPMFSKVDVNGDDSEPLYDYLKKQAPGVLGSKSIKWNFTKFLVNQEGQVIKRFAPKDKPEDIEKEVLANL
ncbi:glutathione peroxidase [Aliikangiella coralliicola]|uniref:Glutathione peroxidase n=1 Tax=Aliikangiella coralliicola TaxID=2592383 RepID=A0A545UAM1_9GAMM|nr:glutathione peroxidase [Aliikangiella coralliicola]TQV86515.1 glutathione peroxidase [Aliikangiella coralliicola]